MLSVIQTIWWDCGLFLDSIVDDALLISGPGAFMCLIPSGFVSWCGISSPKIRNESGLKI